MAVATFDVLKFTHTLKAAGVPDKQAKAEAAAFAEVMRIDFRDLVAKSDPDNAVPEHRCDLSALRAELERELSDFYQEFTPELEEWEAKTDIRLAKIRGAIVLVGWMLGLVITAVTSLLVRFLFER